MQHHGKTLIIAICFATPYRGPMITGKLTSISALQYTIMNMRVVFKAEHPWLCIDTFADGTLQLCNTQRHHVCCGLKGEHIQSTLHVVGMTIVGLNKHMFKCHCREIISASNKQLALAVRLSSCSLLQIQLMLPSDHESVIKAALASVCKAGPKLNVGAIPMSKGQCHCAGVEKTRSLYCRSHGRLSLASSNNCNHRPYMMCIADWPSSPWLASDKAALLYANMCDGDTLQFAL